MSTPTAPTTLRVPRLYNGPPSSGNGGYVAGSLAAVAGHRTTTVQLRQPPPLDVDLPVETLDGWTTASDAEGQPVVRARAADEVPAAVEPVDADVARAARAAYAGLRSHPFPTCFVCGTEREDGLRVFPGRVDDDSSGAVRVAATWTPVESSVPIAWAALDCIGGWAGDLGERMVVLGTMTAQVSSLPERDVEHVVVGRAGGSEGRKTWSSSTLYAPDGRAIAVAAHTWIAVDPRAFA